MNQSYPNMYYPYFDSNYGYACYQWPYYAIACNQMICSTCCQPAQLCQCAKPLSQMKLPQELLADATTTSAQGFVGGLEDATLSLEYLKTGDEPSLKISITQSGSTSEFNIATIEDGYTVKENFSTVSPGAEIKMEVSNCTARLRWCEIICC